MTLTETLSRQLINDAAAKAEELGVRVCIAITDPGAHLNAFQRMDGAFTGSVDVAMAKARTSSLFPLDSGTFGSLVREEKLTGMELCNQGLAAFPGGEPIFFREQQIGAIGISGATAEQDQEIARYALSRLEGEQ